MQTELNSSRGKWLRDYKSEQSLKHKCKVWGKAYHASVFASEHKDVIWLHNLNVHVKNTGNGTAILSHLKQYAIERNKPIKLDMAPELGRDTDLLRFYNKHGFVRYDSRPNALIFRPNGEPTLGHPDFGPVKNRRKRP